MDQRIVPIIRAIAQADPHDTWIVGTTCENIMAIIRADLDIQSLAYARAQCTADQYWICHRTEHRAPTRHQIALHCRLREMHEICIQRTLLPINVADLILIQDTTWTSLQRWLNTPAKEHVHGTR